jgi:hypothetical protein
MDSFNSQLIDAGPIVLPNQGAAIVSQLHQLNMIRSIHRGLEIFQCIFWAPKGEVPVQGIVRHLRGNDGLLPRDKRGRSDCVYLSIRIA